MSILHELVRYDKWATLQLIEYCQRQSPTLLQEIVIGTDRSILHTLTHLIGSEQEYLEELIGEKDLSPVRQGQILSLQEVRNRCEQLSRNWEELLGRIEQIDITLPANGSWPETRHGQNLLILQSLQHGIDHRTQICTTFTILGLEPPGIDGWSYWLAEHQSGS